MPASVILTVIEGKLKGERYVFEERTRSFVGRARDCCPRLPDNDRNVGRHHCLLDIDPPEIRIRDCGSLGGTYVNGQIIGQRPRHQSSEEGARQVFPECDLRKGDEIKVGNTVFLVSILAPAWCDKCSEEIPGDQEATVFEGSNGHRCNAGSKDAENPWATELPAGDSRNWADYEAELSSEAGSHNEGDLVRAERKEDAMRLIKLLFDLADVGDDNLAAIHGYEILEELGTGATGAVYLARHSKTATLVALKLMLPEVAVDEYAKESFFRETENSKALRHPNVVELRDWGFSNGTFFLSMEFCNGGSLDRLVTQRGPLPADLAVRLVLQALDGLEYAHHAEIPYVKLADGTIGRGRGLVHRDIKPPNLLLSGLPTWTVKIGDYGLAKAFDVAGLAGLTKTGTKAGSPRFMPRQQVDNFKYVQQEVDVWAMAASLYYLVTGQSPRNFPEGADPWRVILESAPVPIRERGISIPKRLAEVVDLALVDCPEIHFKTAAELKEALKRAL